MGKRKERRLAAKSATNRRMKLDLCAEISEEVVLSSFNVEVGRNQKEDQCGSAPSSPTSSGGFHESLFKGLYREDISAQHIFWWKFGNTAKRFVAKHLGDFRTNCGKNRGNPLLLLGQYSDVELDEESSELLIDSDDADCSLGLDNKELNHTEASDDLGSSKNIVMEPSTCNEVPDHTVIAKNMNHDNDNVMENNSNDLEECETVLAALSDPSKAVENGTNDHASDQWKLVLHEENNRYYYWNTVTGETSWEVPSDLATNAKILDEPSVQVSEEKVADGFHLNTYTNIAMEIYGQVSSVDRHESCSFVPENADVYENTELKSANVSDITKEDELYDANNASACHRNLYLHSSFSDPKVFHASQLVQYGEILLQKLDKLYRSEHHHEVYERIRTEIDIRMSDCRILSQYGSSLLPFWWHVKEQLKQIESVIIKSEDSIKIQSDEPIQNFLHSEDIENHKTMVVHESGIDTASTKNDEIAAQVNSVLDSSAFVPRFDNGEVDMDVEMEVDDDSLSESPSNQLIQTNPTSSSILPIESIVSPPLEEWIPPPPPDVEPPLPPPLPLDGEANPLEPSATSMYAYPDHYNAGCLIPAYDYYSSIVADVSNGNYYGIAGCSQLSESEQPAYYQPLAKNTLPELLSSGAVVAPAAYIEPSAFYVESGAVSYHDASHVSDQSAVVVDVPVSKESQVAALQVLYGRPTTQTLGSSPKNDGSTQTLAVSKNQTKVERSKKKAVAVAVAPTLRSNKKVSSLVDKWKAAKEELHGEEEEPENPLEILEKKRQKEIAQWRARQVATGEAQDNANFVPLGSDWRDRVKRRRKTESRDEDAPAAAKQLDIAEISKNLPSGWQAYWDDSTKQVYYGNHTTSATTWERPTR